MLYHIYRPNRSVRQRQRQRQRQRKENEVVGAQAGGGVGLWITMDYYGFSIDHERRGEAKRSEGNRYDTTPIITKSNQASYNHLLVSIVSIYFVPRYLLGSMNLFVPQGSLSSFPFFLSLLLPFFIFILVANGKASVTLHARLWGIHQRDAMNRVAAWMHSRLFGSHDWLS